MAWLGGWRVGWGTGGVGVLFLTNSYRKCLRRTWVSVIES